MIKRIPVYINASKRQGRQGKELEASVVCWLELSSKTRNGVGDILDERLLRPIEGMIG